MKDNPTLAPHWAKYAAIQERLNKKGIIDHRERAIDEQANEFIKALVGGTLPEETSARDRWLDSLETNRGKKHRHRERLREQHAHEFTISVAIRTQLDQLLQTELLLLVRNATTLREFRILYRLAANQSYQTIAPDEQMNTGALKTLVCRCRQRLREHLMAIAS